MSKGNMFLGGAAGSVGDVTLSVVNGQQITKRRNRNPRNPKTKRQMFQRATFAGPVKFFVRGQQNLFKFAFEGKKATESDFNAFMRMNAKRGILLSKEKVENAAIGKFGSYYVTQGTLVGMRATAINYVNVEDVALTAIVSDLKASVVPTTIGELSQLILAQNPSMAQGDIITVLTVNTNNGIDIETGELVADGDAEPRWTIRQIIVDITSEDAIPAYWNISLNDAGFIVIADLECPTHEEMDGGAIICSRNVPNGVKVSTTMIIGSDRVKQAVAQFKPNFENPDFTDPYVAMVLESWNATEEAILQGSIARVSQGGDGPKSIGDMKLVHAETYSNPALVKGLSLGGWHNNDYCEISVKLASGTPVSLRLMHASGNAFSASTLPQPFSGNIFSLNFYPTSSTVMFIVANELDDDLDITVTKMVVGGVEIYP